MGAALKFFRELLEKIGLEIDPERSPFEVDRKTATSLLVLIVVLALLPIGIFLIKQQQTLLPKAAGELIQLGEGGCIKFNKDKEKAVDCPLVPLKLINPFFDKDVVTTASTSPTSSTSPSQTPAASVTPGTAVNVKSFNNNIQAALDSIKTTGGSVYIPAGTYVITEKIRMFSNTTIFGDGIDKTILQLADSLLTNEDGILANDTNYGHNNIAVRDMTLKGLGKESGLLQCCVGIKLRQLDGGYFTNIKVEGFSWYGIWLIYKKQTTQGSDTVKNVRISNCQIVNNKGSGIALDSPVSENVVDHCTFSGNNSGNGEDNYLKSGAAIALFMDEDGAVAKNKILNNTITNNSFRGISVMARNNITAIAQKKIPDNAICYNTIENNGDVGIGDANSEDSVYIANKINNNNDSKNGKVQTGPLRYYDHSITRWATSPGNTSTGLIEDESPGATRPECNIPAKLQNIPPAPAKPTAAVDEKSFGIVKKALAQTNPGSDKLLYKLAESQAGLEQAPWKEFAFLKTQTNMAQDTSGLDKLISGLFDKFNPTVQAVDSDDVFINQDAVSSASSSATPGSSGTPSSSIGPQFINTTFQLTNPQIGAKQIWVQYLHPDGTTRVDNVNFNLVEKTPQVLGLACNLDISKENLKITIDGEHFGTGVGTVESVSPAAKPEVLGWNGSQITAFLKKPNIPINEGQRFKIKLTRTDGFESEIATCAVDKSLVSLGARIFCREPGKFDSTNVIVNLVYDPQDPADPDKLNRVEEKVTINADGEIGNLKTKFQVGKNYGIAIKAPSTLRRATTFTAQEGTTQILQPDGNPFILPVGDIAPPISPDGRINTLDRAELIRQWRILGQANTKPSGDFNRDTRVNSIDWACMNYDFGSSDDPIPTSVPQSASGSIHIPGEGTVTIPPSFASPSPSGSVAPEPSPLKDTSNSVKVDIGGKLFLDTNRNKIADIGESFISQGLAVVKLLQVPEDHVIGTALTAEELADSRILTQVTNNLPGANYDISVFVDKDSGTKFSLMATANSGQLTGVVDFAVGPPLVDTNLVTNVPVSSPTQ